MSAEKRRVVGDYFLMSDEGDQHSYYLFRKGQSGSLVGPLREIGWDQHFILVEADGTPGHWAAFWSIRNEIRWRGRQHKEASYSRG